MEPRLFLTRSINSIKKGLKKEVFRSFVRKSNLDLMDSNPSLAEKDSEDLLSFSILNGFHSTLITKPFLMEFNP
jgi:hypothetical protein